MEIINSSKNSVLFLKYIIEEGKFNPDNYKGILELGQSVPSSISQFLTEYKQYLLSKKVDYDRLEEFGIEGANGYLEYNGICVPKSLKNDNYFIDNAPKVPYARHGYNIPSINEFDSIVCEGRTIDLFNACWHDADIFIGYCTNLSNERELEFNRNAFNQYLDSVDVTNFEYEMMKDTDSKKDKEYCLLRRKK